MDIVFNANHSSCRALARCVFLALTAISFAQAALAQTEGAQSAKAPAGRAASLSADAGYIPMADAIKRARAEGGSGDVVQIDLEWDAARSLATWDITFSTGVEHEFDAASGKHLGTNPKSPAKLAAHAPLEPEIAGKKLLTFADIIRKAEAMHGQPVIEMELKRIKARSETLFEVVLGDGMTLHYNAETGETVSGV
jgi:uncharacterized membrane protein YkoI